MKLRTKIIVIILQIALIPLIIGGVFAYMSAKEQINTKTYADLDAIASIQKKRLQDTLENKLDILNLHTMSPLITAALHEYNANPSPFLEKRMQEVISAPGKALGIVRMFIVTPRGIVAFSTDSSLLGLDVSSEEYFRLGLQADEESVLKRGDDGSILHYLAGPLIFDGRTEGVMVIVTDAEDIVSIFQDYTGFGDTGETLFVKSVGSGNILSFTQTRFESRGALSMIHSPGQPDTPAVYAVAGKEAIFANLVDYRGVAVFAATRYLPSVDWAIVVKIDQAEALAPINKLRELFFLIFMMTALLVVFIGISVSKSITDPIRELILFAGKIAGGDLRQSMTVTTKDEVGMLAEAFNSMVSKLQESYETLEKKVAERTKELAEKAKEARNSERAAMNIASDLKEEEEKLDREKKVAEALANDLKKFKIALDNASDQVMITDTEGIVIYANPAIEKITGYKPEEAIGKKSGVLWKSPMPKEYYQNLWRTIQAKKTFVGEIQNRRKNGQLYTAMISISPCLGTTGETLFYVGIERDITKEKEMDKAKSEFISLASHQMRTPLTAVNWYTEMLLGGDAGELNDKQADYFREIYSAAQKMNEIIKSFLHILRLEVGSVSVNPVSVDLTEMMRGLIKDQEIDIKKRHLKVTEQYQESLPLLSVDTELVRVILQNLVSNAIKYAFENGEIRVSLKRVKKGVAIADELVDEDSIVVSVYDSGIGIPSKDHEKIFTKFFRAENAKRLDPNGNGLGLYMAKFMADLIGGSIRFTSEEGKGTTFFLVLPLAGKKMVQ